VEIDHLRARCAWPVRTAAATNAAMSSDVTVRPARPEDERFLGRLGAMLVEEHHHFDPRRFIAPLPDLAERYGQFLVSRTEREDTLVLVAERAGELVGYAFGGIEGNDYMALRGAAGGPVHLLCPSRSR